MKHSQIFIFICLMCSLSYSQESTWSYPLMAAMGEGAELSEASQNPFVFNINQSGKKAAGKAFFLSLIVPGAGEAYLGRTGYTRFFLSVEAIAWGLLIANQLNINWQTKDYQSYAMQHAGVYRDGKDDDFWINIGKYNTIYDYNEQKRRERDVEAIYMENSFYAWHWDSQANRYYYDLKRLETRELEAHTVYFMGAIVLNHLASAINALRLARGYNKQEELSWRLDCQYNPMTSRLMFFYYKTF